MSQRTSGYERLPGDTYTTPVWVTEALLPHLRAVRFIWEPAAGSGKMAGALRRDGFVVLATDIDVGVDFLTAVPPLDCDAVVTNPPYTHAHRFIERAIGIMRQRHGLVAMLLRCDYDHAATRSDLFKRPQFAKKLVLTKRIRWIEGSTGSPSFNHAWYIWDWRHEGPPTIAYGPETDVD